MIKREAFYFFVERRETRLDRLSVYRLISICLIYLTSTSRHLTLPPPPLPIDPRRTPKASSSAVILAARSLIGRSIRRFDTEAAIQAQAEQVREHYRNLAQQQPARAPEPEPAPAPAPEPRHKPRGHSRRGRREARPQHQQAQPQYRRGQPPAEPQPNYSPNLPSHLRELLKYQAQIPYNIIANQVAYRGPDKPYVPHYVDPSQQQQQPQLQQAQYQAQGGAYQAQGGGYQAQESAYTQTRYDPNLQYQQSGYNQQQQQSGVRPVTENQY